MEAVWWKNIQITIQNSAPKKNTQKQIREKHIYTKDHKNTGNRKYNKKTTTKTKSAHSTIVRDSHTPQTTQITRRSELYIITHDAQQKLKEKL